MLILLTQSGLERRERPRLTVWFACIPHLIRGLALTSKNRIVPVLSGSFRSSTTALVLVRYIGLRVLSFARRPSCWATGYIATDAISPLRRVGAIRVVPPRARRRLLLALCIRAAGESHQSGLRLCSRGWMEYAQRCRHIQSRKLRRWSW